ncbi:hypothetical protein ABID19_003183 [Mesorhizobium robiniae]|uniref:Uncharacterized protein n=1 Tax=Mesorhizobium robiniae TaxID=559315 RepID=A0ABV2GPD5_9HYPH
MVPSEIDFDFGRGDAPALQRLATNAPKILEY